MLTGTLDAIRKMYADLKFSLIDLEGFAEPTGRKGKASVRD
jgi:hypothetical protein